MILVNIPQKDKPIKRFYEAKSVKDLFEQVSECVPHVRFRLVAPFGDLRDGNKSHDDLVTGGGWLSVNVLLPLLGGKGGFGTLLKKQTGQGKKTTNFDSCRDLQGRRLRHSKAVERIKGWLETKKQEDELVAALTDKHATKSNDISMDVKIDQAYIDKLKQSARGKKRLVEAGLEAAELREKDTPEPKKKKAKPLQGMDPLALLSCGSSDSASSSASCDGSGSDNDSPKSANVGGAASSSQRPKETPTGDESPKSSSETKKAKAVIKSPQSSKIKGIPQEAKRTTPAMCCNSDVESASSPKSSDEKRGNDEAVAIPPKETSATETRDKSPKSDTKKAATVSQ